MGWEPTQVIAPDINETRLPKESPRAFALRMAEEKARTIAALHPGQIILSGDTVVAVGQRVLPKTQTREEAHKCLTLLSGRRHRVYGGIALVRPENPTHPVERSYVLQTVVQFKRLSEKEIAGYLDSEEWLGKAGGYAIQGRAARLIRFISGSYSNIVGFDLYTVAKLLDPD